MNLILLDRDGVINEDSDHYIKSAEEWQPIPGSIDSIARLAKAGFTLAVITNQSGIGRGLFDRNTLKAMHQKLHFLVNQAGGKISTIAYCPHLPEDHCSCRKPATGMVHQIESTLETPVTADTWFVGDSLKDLQTAQAVQCRPALVLTGKGQKTLSRLDAYPDLKSTPVFANLADFADSVIREH